MSKCPWCGTRVEGGSTICRACGITLPGERPGDKPDGVAPERRREDGGYSRRLLRIALVVAALAALGIGGAYWLQQQSQRREAQRQEGERRLRVVEAERRAAEVNARARDHLRKGQFAAGLEAVDSVLDLIEHPDVLANLLETKFDLLYIGRQRNEAYQVLLRLSQCRPAAAHYERAAGGLALELGQFKAAMAHFESAARLAPQNTTYQIEWANVCLRCGELEQGRALLQKLVEQDPQCEDCWYHYASAYADYGALERAIKVFRQSADQFPEGSSQQFHLALALEAHGRQANDKAALDEAVTHYRRSLELRPMRNSRAAQRILELTGQPVPPELERLVLDEVPLESVGETLYVRARINGVEGRFLLDTGASYVAVYSNAVPRFKLAATARVMEVKTANGVVQVPVAYGELRLGKQKLPEAVICFIRDVEGDPSSGLLGMQFLRRFGAQIDLAHQRLVLSADAAVN